MGEREAPDWLAIEQAFCGDRRPIRAIARAQGVDESAIRRRAKRLGWTRAAPVDCGGLLTVAPRLPSGTRSGSNTRPPSQSELADRGARLVEAMLHELEFTTEHIGEIRQLIDDEARAMGATERARRAAHSAISLKSRSDTLRALATAAKAFDEVGAGQGGRGLKRRRQAAAERAATRGVFSVPPPPLRFISDDDDGDDE